MKDTRSSFFELLRIKFLFFKIKGNPFLFLGAGQRFVSRNAAAELFSVSLEVLTAGAERMLS